MSKFLRFSAWTLVIVGAIIGIARLTVIRWWQVPLGDPYLEASLAPTLRGGDWIILWRGSAPIEGALVLCPEPKASGRVVIARLLGEARDHVKVNSNLLVNERAFETESERTVLSGPTSIPRSAPNVSILASRSLLE